MRERERERERIFNRCAATNATVTHSASVGSHVIVMSYEHEGSSLALLFRLCGLVC